MDGANQARLAVERLGKVWQLQKGQVRPDQALALQSASSCFFQCKPLILLYEVARVLKEAIEEGKGKADLEAPWGRAIFYYSSVLYYSLIAAGGGKQLCSLENMMGPPVARHSLTTNQFSEARKRFTGYGGVSESGLRCLLEEMFFI